MSRQNMNKNKPPTTMGHQSISGTAGNQNRMPQSLFEVADKENIEPQQRHCPFDNAGTQTLQRLFHRDVYRSSAIVQRQARRLAVEHQNVKRRLFREDTKQNSMAQYDRPAAGTMVLCKPLAFRAAGAEYTSFEAFEQKRYSELKADSIEHAKRCLFGDCDNQNNVVKEEQSLFGVAGAQKASFRSLFGGQDPDAAVMYQRQYPLARPTMDTVKRRLFPEAYNQNSMEQKHTSIPDTGVLQNLSGSIVIAESYQKAVRRRKKTVSGAERSQNSSPETSFQRDAHRNAMAEQNQKTDDAGEKTYIEKWHYL